MRWPKMRRDQEEAGIVPEVGAAAAPSQSPPATAEAPRARFAREIGAEWRATLEHVLRSGRLLIEAKKALPVGEFGAMVEADLPFGRRTAQILMRIAMDPRLNDANHGSHLPPAWQTLHALSRLDRAHFDAALLAGQIRADMERKDAERLVRAQNHAASLRRVERLAAAGTPALPRGAPLEGEAGPEGAEGQEEAPARRYAVLYADPPWRNEVWSEKGHEKSPERHYPTMGVDEICALPVWALAADDAVLFLWTTGNRLDLGLRVMAAAGFAFKASQVWGKTNEDGELHRGTGYWFIDCHEILLVGTRGKPPAPLPGTQPNSLILAPIGRHSEKPDRFREIIDAFFPGVTKLELFARLRDGETGRPGWDLWGNEAGGPVPEGVDPETGEVLGDGS